MNLEDFKNPEFKIGALNFRIVKVNAEDGFPLLEMIRCAVTDPASMKFADGADQSQAGASLMRAVLAIDPAKLAKIRDELFKHIEVCVDGGAMYQRLPKVRSVVMDNIEAPDVYEIIVRAIVVNFTKSFVGLLTRLGLASQG